MRMKMKMKMKMKKKMKMKRRWKHQPPGNDHPRGTRSVGFLDMVLVEEELCCVTKVCFNQLTKNKRYFETYV